MDLRPTNRKTGYALILSVFISLLFFSFYAKDKKPLEGVLLSPGEFHLIYLVPILSFLASYFVVCWLVFKGADKSLMEKIK